MNEQLRALYDEWKDVLPRNEAPPDLLGPPHLVSVTPTYEQSHDRVLIIGQEDYGNQWTKSSLSYPAYKYDPTAWTYPDFENWHDFLEQPSAVEALMHGCSLFDFCEKQPGNRNSPLWKAFRTFTDEGIKGALTNLDRASYSGGPILSGPAEVRRFLSSQDFPEGHEKLLSREVRILEPNVCIFFTSADRDDLIKANWPGVEFEAVFQDLPADQIARVSHRSLPAHSYRTYHPGHLSRCGKTFYLQLIADKIRRAQ